MIEIYSDASLTERNGYRIGSYCSIIPLSGRKVILHGKSIKKDGSINGLEYKASMKGIMLAVEVLQIKPEELIAFVDNYNAYKLLLHNKYKVRIKFIGGEMKKHLTDKDKQLYQLCDMITKRTTASLSEKMKTQKNIDEMEEERIGTVRTINNLPVFIEEVIEPAIIEKIRMETECRERTIKNFNELLEEGINEYMRDNNIIAITTSDAKNQLYLTAKEILNTIKAKKIETIKKRILSLV